MSPDPNIKTLVFTHGFIGSCIFYFHAMAKLASKYRIVMFDNCCKGMNDRIAQVDPELTQNAAQAEQWLTEFMVKTMDRLDLPSKFLLTGHSYGGYLVSLYASVRPERVESMFLISPAFMEPYDPQNFDPTQFSDAKDPSKRISLAFVESMDRMQEAGETPLD